MDILSALAGPGACGIIAFYLIRTTIPAMVKAFEDEQAAERKACKENADDERTLFRGEMAAERKQHGQHIERLVSRLEVLEHGVLSIQAELRMTREAEEPPVVSQAARPSS